MGARVCSEDTENMSCVCCERACVCGGGGLVMTLL